MEPLTLRLFGDVELSCARGQEIVLPRKTRMLLAFLAMSEEQKFSRDKIAALLWETRSEEQARHSLRQCLFTLGRSLDDHDTPLILADRTQLSLNRGLLEVDVWQFERHVAAGSPADLEKAAALYRGDLLAGLSFEQDSLDAWCAAERTRLCDRFHEALATLTSHYADTFNLDAAIETGRRLVNLDPLREDAHRTLIRLYHRAGRRADALKQYRHCVETLRRELNVEPEPATTRLYLEIRKRPGDGAQSLEATATPPEGSRAVLGGLPGIIHAVDRHILVSLFAGLAVLLGLATMILVLGP